MKLEQRIRAEHITTDEFGRPFTEVLYLVPIRELPQKHKYDPIKVEIKVYKDVARFESGDLKNLDFETRIVTKSKCIKVEVYNNDNILRESTG